VAARHISWTDCVVSRSHGEIFTQGFGSVLYHVSHSKSNSMICKLLFAVQEQNDMREAAVSATNDLLANARKLIEEEKHEREQTVCMIVQLRMSIRTTRIAGTDPQQPLTLHI
jgi:hypothetical protein